MNVFFYKYIFSNILSQKSLCCLQNVIFCAYLVLAYKANVVIYFKYQYIYQVKIAPQKYFLVFFMKRGISRLLIKRAGSLHIMNLLFL